jgi:hypothetical protein
MQILRFELTAVGRQVEDRYWAWTRDLIKTQRQKSRAIKRDEGDKRDKL